MAEVDDAGTSSDERPPRIPPPNIFRGCVAASCHRTFHGEHGAAVPGGPFPGTHGRDGDVRRCEHGVVWAFDHCEVYTIDVWRRLSRFREPIQYHRAVTLNRWKDEHYG